MNLCRFEFSASGFTFATTLVLIFATSFFAQDKSEVFVLSALHQYHGKDNTYTFENLSAIVEGYRPDIIAVELTPADLESRREQKLKLEYQNSIFETADKLKVKMVPMEPAEPKFSEILGLIRESDSETREKRPDAAGAFSKYADSLYEYLFRYWKSAAEVNSPRTDAFFEVKHEFQNKVFGEKQERGWEAWNTHFLETILGAARDNPGKRIVVIVGAEHSYWLRKKLRMQNEVRLVEPDEVLRQQVSIRLGDVKDYGDQQKRFLSYRVGGGDRGGSRLEGAWGSES